ncbi:MAG: hypothetical protein QOH21_2266 [Acidobacteriota bacterium]|jgi:heme/copper-type cytochrome/quinol oxidase subunit 2|nr:hypothetical protein [Acidobacteriota bacterium]
MASVSLRERIAAVGCGGLVLLVGALIFVVSSVNAFGRNFPQLLSWFLLAVFAIFVLCAFGVGLRPGEDDEDPFHGDRATALAVTLVVIIAVIVLLAVLLLNPDFWTTALHS